MAERTTNILPKWFSADQHLIKLREILIFTVLCSRRLLSWSCCCSSSLLYSSTLERFWILRRFFLSLSLFPFSVSLALSLSVSLAMYCIYAYFIQFRLSYWLRRFLAATSTTCNKSSRNSKFIFKTISKFGYGASLPLRISSKYLSVVFLVVSVCPLCARSSSDSHKMRFQSVRVDFERMYVCQWDKYQKKKSAIVSSYFCSIQCEWRIWWNWWTIQLNLRLLLLSSMSLFTKPNSLKIVSDFIVVWTIKYSP